MSIAVNLHYVCNSLLLILLTLTVIRLRYTLYVLMYSDILSNFWMLILHLKH